MATPSMVVSAHRSVTGATRARRALRFVKTLKTLAGAAVLILAAPDGVRAQ